MVAKCAPKIASSLLKLKNGFDNCTLSDTNKHLNECITDLESMQYNMDVIPISTKMSDIDFLIHILNNSPELYNVVLDGM